MYLNACKTPPWVYNTFSLVASFLLLSSPTSKTHSLSLLSFPTLKLSTSPQSSAKRSLDRAMLTDQGGSQSCHGYGGEYMLFMWLLAVENLAFVVGHVPVGICFGYLLHESNRPSLGSFVTKFGNESNPLVLLSKSHQMIFMSNHSDFCPALYRLQTRKLAFRVPNCYQFTNLMKILFWFLYSRVKINLVPTF